MCNLFWLTNYVLIIKWLHFTRVMVVCPSMLILELHFYGICHSSFVCSVLTFNLIKYYSLLCELKNIAHYKVMCQSLTKIWYCKEFMYILGAVCYQHRAPTHPIMHIVWNKEHKKRGRVLITKQKRRSSQSVYRENKNPSTLTFELILQFFSYA